MPEVAIMIEGQDGVNWPRWQRIARAVDDLGFAGLFRSDHFTNYAPPDKDSLELWVSFTWLASHTRRIEFGSLVSPVSFRDPVFTARMGLQVNDLSGGRLRLGVGAGWQEREHSMFGYDLLPLSERFQRFQEGLEIITRLVRSETPLTFQGKFYQVKEARLLPRPKPGQKLPIVIGGNGEKRTLPLAARYADEWNAVALSPERMTRLNHRLDDLLHESGRDPAEVRRTMMTTVLYARNQAEAGQVLAGRDPDQLRQHGVLFGTAGEIQDQLGLLGQAGVSRVMLRWEDLDDLEGLERFAKDILPTS